MMRGQVPGSRSAHRESPDRQALIVDGIPGQRVPESLENVDLSRKLEGVAIPPVRVKNECIGRREFSIRLLPVVDELQLGQMIVPTVQPDIEPMRSLAVPGERAWHNESVGLSRAIDL